LRIAADGEYARVVSCLAVVHDGRACQLAFYGASPAGGDGSGVFRAVPEGQLGRLLTWADFRVRV
jgi:hypothetical protein